MIFLVGGIALVIWAGVAAVQAAVILWQLALILLLFAYVRLIAPVLRRLRAPRGGTGTTATLSRHSSWGSESFEVVR